MVENGAAAPRSEPDNRELRNQIDSMKGQIKHWRAEAVKFRDESKFLRNGGEHDHGDETRRRKQGGGQRPQQGLPRKVQKGGGKGGKTATLAKHVVADDYPPTASYPTQRGRLMKHYAGPFGARRHHVGSWHEG